MSAESAAGGSPAAASLALVSLWGAAYSSPPAPVGAAVAADLVGPAEPNPAGARLCPHCGQASWWLLEEQLPSRSLGELAWLYFRPGAEAGRGYWNSS